MRAEILTERRDYYCNHKDKLRAKPVAKYYVHHNSRPLKAYTRAASEIRYKIMSPLELPLELAIKQLVRGCMHIWSRNGLVGHPHMYNLPCNYYIR